MDVISATAFYVLLIVAMVIIVAAVALVGQMLLRVCSRKGRESGAPSSLK
jgi:hypothetical protein